MAENTNVAEKQNNSVANLENLKMADYLAVDVVKNNIISVVGKDSAARFISSVISAVQTNPTLAQCTKSSILSSALLGETLKLTPSPQLGQYYMVPYDNNKAKRKEAQFQIGYKGYIQLAVRSGQYRKITVSEVKEGEFIDYNPITEDVIMKPIENAREREKLRTVGYYAMFELVNGFRKEIYWTKEKMEDHAETYSIGYKSDLKKRTSYTFWSKNFDAMAKKTLIRQLISKWGIMSVEMQKAYESDMAVLDENGIPHYVDNQQNVQEIVHEEIEQNANQQEFEEVTI